MPPKQIGTFSEDIINALGLNIPINTPIYLGETNISHMKNKHPNDFLKYGEDIGRIIGSPDYIGVNQKDDSVEFVKEYFVAGDFVKVAVRVSAKNNYYARSLYILNPNRVKNFIAKGTLVKLDK